MNNAQSMALKTKKALSSDIVKKVFKYKSVILMIIYHLCPIDVLPDAIPLVGQIDEIFITVWSMCNIILGTQEEVPNYVSSSPQDTSLNQVVNGIGQVANVIKQSPSQTSKSAQIQMLAAGMQNIQAGVQTIKAGMQTDQAGKPVMEMQNMQTGMPVMETKNMQTGMPMMAMQNMQTGMPMMAMQNIQAGMHTPEMQTVPAVQNEPLAMQNMQAGMQNPVTETIQQVEASKIIEEPLTTTEYDADEEIDIENTKITFNGKSFDIDL